MHRPCRIGCEKPTAAADSGSECSGLRSPHNRYTSARCGRIGSGASKSGALSGSALFVDGPRSPPAVALALLPPRRHAQLDVETCHVAKGGSTCGRRDQVAQFPQRSTPSPSPFRLSGYRRSVATIANCGWAGVLLPGDEVRSVPRGISHAESAYK